MSLTFVFSLFLYITLYALILILSYQKGKSSASFLYSILNVYTSARNEKIKTDAQQLVQKVSM